MLALDLLLVAHSGLGVVLSWDAIDVEEVVYHAISEICSIRPLVNPVSSCHVCLAVYSAFDFHGYIQFATIVSEYILPLINLLSVRCLDM